MQDFASVVARPDFVQAATAAQNKFKLSVAGALHPAARKGPKLEQVNDSHGGAAATGKRHLPLTALNDAVLNRNGLGEDAMAEDADVIVVGGGLAGLVAATEIADAGKRVIVVDQEGEQSLGGQAFWSFGGLFLVDQPEQRRLGIKDSFDLALQDWMGTRGFRSRRGSLAEALGGSLCRVRGRRKTRLAARDGPSHLSGGRLGRARRL